MINLLIILVIIALATVSGWALWSYLSQSSDTENNVNSYISQQLKYQVSFFILATLVVWCSYKISGNFFGLGDFRAELNTYGYFPKLQNISWLYVALSLVVIFLVSTYLMVFEPLSKINNWKLFLKKYGVWVLILASLNSLSEELIYRGALIAVIDGGFSHWFIALISGVIFMLAHIKGQIKGLFVLLGSGFVGWCLAYVVLQTQGLLWAWLIHFAQDAVIFSAFIATFKNKKNIKN